MMERGEDIQSRYEREARYVEELKALAHEALKHLDNGCHPVVSELVKKSLDLSEASKLLAGAHRERLQNDVFIRIGAKLSTTLALDELLPQIIDSLLEVVHYDAAGIFLVDSETGQIQGQVLRGYEIDALHRVRQKVGQGVMGVVIQTGEPLRIGDVHRDPRYIDARPQTQSEMAVPLLSEGRVIGCFNLESDHPNAYTDQDQELLTTLASHAAIAIERVRFYRDVLQKRRYEEELALARQIQLSLLPRTVPRFPPYDLAGINFPSSAVGGDYYDFIPQTEKDLGIVIGDVSGKGIGAALIMASFRASLRVECQHNYAIREILSRVSHFLWESTAPESFVTAFYGVLDKEHHQLTYGNAGHDPPVLVRANGGREMLDATGIVLGAIAGAEYEERVVEFHPGDTLLMYTDGVTEARNSKGEEFQLEGMMAEYLAHCDLPAGPLVQRISRDVQRFTSPEPVGDDVTLIAVKLPEGKGENGGGPSE
jgi:sigma-B regulation protein RsbU (phosphoserine phosphatase)